LNIFVLDKNPAACAAMHCDKHVVKMILEYAQLLSTAHRLLDGTPIRMSGAKGKMVTKYVMEDPDMEEQLYRQTHINHPCGIWARECADNYVWLFRLFIECCRQYTLRYGKVHATERLIPYLGKLPQNIDCDKTMTPFAQAMPDECKHDNPVMAYRKYYKDVKHPIAKWSYTAEPHWWG